MNEKYIIGNSPGTNIADACCAPSRESAQATLRNHANQLRRKAGELHAEADRIEQLANVSAGLNGPAEEALWRLAIEGISRAASRLF